MAPQFYCTGRKKIMLNKKMNRVAAVCSYMSPFHIHKNSWIHRKKTGKLPSFKPLRVMSIFDEACWICPILHQSRPSRGCYVYVPSRKLTYPILGKKKLISNRAVGGDVNYQDITLLATFIVTSFVEFLQDFSHHQEYAEYHPAVS